MQFTATTTPVNVLASQPKNRCWQIQNIGTTNTAFIARTSADCTSATGFRIVANGGSILITIPAQKHKGTDQLWVCTASGTTDMRLVEL